MKLKPLVSTVSTKKATQYAGSRSSLRGVSTSSMRRPDIQIEADWTAGASMTKAARAKARLKYGRKNGEKRRPRPIREAPESGATPGGSKRGAGMKAYPE